MASARWEARRGPKRQVVDQVCLVPDLPTFLEAIATWDDLHYFPILLDDTETVLRFLRAFRPARVVRLPSRAEPIEPGTLWDRALAAVARSWILDEMPPAEIPKGDQVPRRLGPLPPPGVVVSSPESPMLAGAVALAAGRFQPLTRWDTRRTSRDRISADEADQLAFDLETRIANVVDQYQALGDDCDFITLAGDWPDRYDVPSGPKAGTCAFDDLIARTRDTKQRWAFTGRLTGDLSESLYEAMCSLFLQPESALLFNGYNEKEPPWSDYSMRAAGQRLGQVVPVVQRAGPEQASLAGWHRTFDPINRYGLVLINSSGGSGDFNLPGGGGRTTDVPMSVPAALVVIHSFSAAEPGNPATLAGRWLANGAFLYFGSMNEPYLQAFRTPGLVAEMLADGLPIGAVTRQLQSEGGIFGTPWRLHLLGDPLYRLDPNAARAPRLKTWQGSAEWPAYAERSLPAPSADDATRLQWALQTAIVQAARREGGEARNEWSRVMLSISRANLAPELKPVHDDLLADLVTFARRNTPWRAKVEAIPQAERSDALRRSLEAREALGVDSR